MKNNDLPGIISQDQFNLYAAKWLTTVGNADETELQKSFDAPTGGGKLLQVSFSMEQIVQLVSVVGARYIMARFLVVATDLPRFTLALFAADAQRVRLSSYYIANEVATPSPSLPGEEVPDVLAKQWLQTWTDAPKVLRTMFDSNITDASLQGYTFEIGDFLAMLFDLPQVAGETLPVLFGLHEYYRPGPQGDDVLAQTFGLVLRRTSAGETATFYDMTSPCPPIC